MMKNNSNFDPLAWAAAGDNNGGFDPLAWAAAGDTPEAAPNANRQESTSACQISNPDTELAKAEAVGNELIARGANIAESYDDYLRLGFALANGLGASGGSLFHRLCAQSPKYRQHDCEEKWQQCLKASDGRITIATYYQMASQAGVDLGAVSRQFGPLGPLGHGSTAQGRNLGENTRLNLQLSNNQLINNNDYTSTLSKVGAEYTRGPMAQVAQTPSSPVEQEASIPAGPTFSDTLDADALPPLVREAMMTQSTAEGRDMVVLATLNLASGFMHNVKAIYDKRVVYPPFYLFVVAPSGADKGMLPACLALVEPVVSEIRSRNEAERLKYKEEKAQYEALDRRQKASALEPEEPPFRSAIISVNASATAFYQDLAANDGWGAVFETEADNMTQTLKQDYGDYTSGLRKAFHHEPIEYSRRKDNEHVYIAEPKLSALITCTPGQVPLMLSPQNTENGLANRFLFYLQRGRHQWRNVFEDCELTLKEQLAPLGKLFLSLYHEMESKEQGKLVFTFSEEQKQSFNAFFSPLYNEHIGLFGDDLDAFIKRLGLITFRLAMVLTVLRRAGQQTCFSPFDEPLVCSDADYRTAVTIADCLISHTVQVYSHLLPHKQGIVGSSGRVMTQGEQAFWQALPEGFSTADFVAIARSMGIPERTAKRYVGNFVKDFGLLSRVAQGHYVKR